MPVSFDVYIWHQYISLCAAMGYLEHLKELRTLCKFFSHAAKKYLFEIIFLTDNRRLCTTTYDHSALQRIVSFGVVRMVVVTGHLDPHIYKTLDLFITTDVLFLDQCCFLQNFQFTGHALQWFKGLMFMCYADTQAACIELALMQHQLYYIGMKLVTPDTDIITYNSAKAFLSAFDLCMKRKAPHNDKLLPRSAILQFANEENAKTVTLLFTKPSIPLMDLQVLNGKSLHWMLKNFDDNNWKDIIRLTVFLYGKLSLENISFVN